MGQNMNLKHTLIGVISYLPDNDQRAYRLERVQKQVDWLRSHFGDTKIVTCAQCYHDDEYIDGVEYISYDHGIMPAGARNAILRYFYNSDYDWLILMDDDCVIFDYFGAPDLSYILDQDPSTDIDLISGFSPYMSGFRDFNLKNQSIIEDNFTLGFTSRTIQYCELKNLKKHYNKEIYFLTVEETGGIYCFEDFLWTRDLLAAGMNCRCCRQWIYNNFGLKYSTLADNKTTKQNQEWHVEVQDRTLEFYKKRFDLPDTNYHNVFKRRYNVRRGTELIKRLEHYTFTDKDLDYKPRKKSNI